MSTELGKAYVQIVPSAKGISGSLQKEISGAAGPAGKSGGLALASKLKGALAAAGIGAAIGNGIKAAISEGSKLQQSIGGIETLFKGNAKTVINNASKSYKTAGLSANEYMENVTSFSASLISSLGGDTKAAASLADTAMSDMSDNANKMGTDMSSITQTYQSLARGNYAMLDNLKLGYGGTKSEMERLMADAEKLTGEHYTVGDFGDTVKAIHAVQDHLGITGTTAREAASTMSGSFAAMKAAGKDLLGNLALGKNIQPSLKALASTAKTFFFGNFLPMIGTILKGLPPLITGAIKEVIPQFNSGFPKMLNNAVRSATKALPGVLESGVQIISSLVSGALKALPKLTESIGTFIQLNLPTIAAKAGKLMLSIGKALITNLPAIVAAMFKLHRTIISSIASLAIKLIKSGLSMMKSLASGILRGVKSTVGGVLKGIWNAVKKTATTVFKQLQTVVTARMNAIKKSITTVWTAVKTWLSKTWTNIKSTASRVWTAVKNAVMRPINAAKSLLSGAWSAIRSAASAAWTKAKSTASTVWNAIKNAIYNPIKSAKSSLSSVVGAIKSTLSNAWSNIKSKASSTWNAIKNVIMKPINAAKNAVKAAIQKIRSYFHFSWHLPHLKLPHFSVSGWFSLDPPSVPHFSIDWYKEGGIMSRPTLFGGGEAGPEAILPLDPFWKRLDQMADNIVSGVATVAAANAGGGGDIHLDVYLYPSGPKMMEHIVKAYDTGKRRLG